MKLPIVIFSLVLVLVLATAFVTPAAYENKLVVGIDTVSTRLNRQQCRSGLLWTLSYLGATLPAAQVASAIKWQSDSALVIYPDLLGLGKTGEQAFEKICDSLRNTSQYRATGAVPAGAFVAVMVGCSEHYYAITEAPRTLKAFRKQHRTKKTPFLVKHSAIANRARRVYFGLTTAVQFWALAIQQKEGRESAEAIDVMANGQLRFLIYNENGQLSSAPADAENLAGKPAKCMWCHEGKLQRTHGSTDQSGDELLFTVDSMNKAIKQFRQTRESGFSYEPHGAHTYMEILYISYLEPTLQQLSHEWRMKSEDIRLLLRMNKRHLHPEFSFGDSLYTRSGITAAAPYSIPVPDDVREWRLSDPNFLWTK